MGQFRDMMTPEQKRQRAKQQKEMEGNSIVPWYDSQDLRFTAEQLPEIKKWEVGQEYEVTIKVRMKSYEMEKNERKSGGKEHARFEVIAVKSNGSGLTSKQKDMMDKMGVKEEAE